MVTIETLLENWLPLVGGVSGLSLIIYMVLMLYFSRKKDRDVQELRIQVAELKGLLQGRKR